MNQSYIVGQTDQYLWVWKPHGRASSWGQQYPFLSYIQNCIQTQQDSMRENQKQIFGPEGEYGLLNRLDNDTTGLLYFARSVAAKDIYRQQQKSGQIIKTYYACVHGHIRQQFGTIDAMISHHPSDATRMQVDICTVGPHITDRFVVERSYIYTDTGTHAVTWLQVHIHAGCRHQIRAHLAGQGMSIVGDSLYTPKWLRKQTAYIGPLQLVSSGIALDPELP